MTAATTGRERRVTIATASASWSQATTPKKTPCVHETPACSPIIPKWIPAAPSRRPATTQLSTVPIVVVIGRLGWRGGRACTMSGVDSGASWRDVLVTTVCIRFPPVGLCRESYDLPAQPTMRASYVPSGADARVGASLRMRFSAARLPGRIVTRTRRNHARERGRRGGGELTSSPGALASSRDRDPRPTTPNHPGPRPFVSRHGHDLVAVSATSASVASGRPPPTAPASTRAAPNRGVEPGKMLFGEPLSHPRETVDVRDLDGPDGDRTSFDGPGLRHR